MTCIRFLEKLEGIGGGPFTKALKILKEDPLWRDVFLALSEGRKKDFVLNLQIFMFMRVWIKTSRCTAMFG
jgi:hypothetical protein